jgi:predicted 2-oxoglutarate/Fe(II)-dependent dioxygenase YbiX
VSFSLLLSKPHDFVGGDLVVDEEKAPLGLGDLVAFTGTTRHEVTQIRRGQRMVLIAVGHSTLFDPRWPDPPDGPMWHYGPSEGAGPR